MRRILGAAALTALVACNGDGKQQTYGSTDIRIDGGGEQGDPDSVGTQMCVNDVGNVFIAWEDDRNGSSDIWFNRSVDAGQTWLTAPIQLNTGLGEAIAPDIGCTESGVFVVWEDDRDGELENHNIYFSRSLDKGETWLSQDIALDDDPDGDDMSLGPQLAVQSNRVHVVWFDSRNGAYDIYVASSGDQGGAFDPPVRVDGDNPGDAYSASPQVVADAGNRVIVTWEDSRDGASDIYAAVSSNGGSSFAREVRLDEGDALGGSNSFEPRIAARDGTVYAVWHDERNGDGRDIFLNWSSDGGDTWASDAVRVESDTEGFFDSLNPVVAVARGKAHIAWQDDRNGGYDIYYRTATDGAFSAEEVRLDTDPLGEDNSFSARVDALDQTIVVAYQDRRYDDEDEGYDDLFYNVSLDGGLTWQSSDLRVDSWEDGTKFAVDQNVAIFRDQAFFAWTDGRRGSEDVLFTSLTLGEESAYYAPPE